MGLIHRVNERGQEKLRFPGWEKLKPQALKAHDSHMICRSYAADQGNFKSYSYHNTAAKLVIRKGRTLTPEEKKSLWDSKSKKFKTNKFSDIETKYPGLRRLANK
jgi:hypothetical protein